MDRAADNHYPTNTTDLIAARDVPSIAKIVLENFAGTLEGPVPSCSQLARDL
jgi:hypothetical protein